MSLFYIKKNDNIWELHTLEPCIRLEDGYKLPKGFKGLYSCYVDARAGYLYCTRNYVPL